MRLDFCFSLSSSGLYIPAVASVYITVAVVQPVVNYTIHPTEQSTIRILASGRIKDRDNSTILSFFFFWLQKEITVGPLSLSVGQYYPACTWNYIMYYEVESGVSINACKKSGYCFSYPAF
jgi:hypothetical protein